MTNFFERLFGKQQADTHVLEAPSKELFVASEPPVQEEVKRGAIKQFLDKDYEAEGKQCGYKFHNQEEMEYLKRRIKAHFQKVLSSVQEKLNEELQGNRIKSIHLGEGFESHQSILELGNQEIENKIKQLEGQRTLSIDGEGWISPALYDFEKGFREGLLFYIEETSFLTRNLI